MKKVLICFVFISLFLFVGCRKDTTDQEEKNDYLALKSDLISKTDFSQGEELNLDISVSIERVDEESISYTTTLSNVKENMNNIKVLVVHNYFTEDVFPSIGIFDDTKNLMVNDDNNITLVGYIDTTKDIRKLDLELKIWIQYIDDEGEVKDIYYKTTK